MGLADRGDQDEQTLYRLMYLMQIGDTIHIQHCFEKDSRKTGRRDLEMAKAKLKEVRQRPLDTK
jgi:phage-related protein